MMDRIVPGAPTMTTQEFIQIWRNSRFGESQGATSFFDDICRLVGHPRPADIQDPEDFTFEKRCSVVLRTLTRQDISLGSSRALTGNCLEHSISFYDIKFI